MLRIRPEAEISVINCHIESLSQLERICTETYHYDLIIKAVDSPAEFPQWLDQVCRKHKLSYIAGIASSKKLLIGPTFVPGVSEIGWGDILPVTGDIKRIAGLNPSFGLMLNEAACSVSMEAFKVLSGSDTPQYYGRILIKDVFSGDEQYLEKERTDKVQKRISEEKPDYNPNLISVLLCTLLYGLGSVWHIEMFILGFVYCFLISLLSSSPLVRKKYAFSITSALSVFLLISIMRRIILSGYGLIQSLGVIVIVFILISLVLLLAVVFSGNMKKTIEKHFTEPKGGNV